LTYYEVFEGFKTLDLAEKRRLLDAGRQLISVDNWFLLAGAKVQFKTKNGSVIPGTLVKTRRKTAEVISLFGRNGVKSAAPLRWNVALELLIPLSPEQIKLLEFP
jgi:hypothetical protein